MCSASSAYSFNELHRVVRHVDRRSLYDRNKVCVCVCVCVGAEQDMQGDAAAGSGADLQGLQRGDDRGTAACQR